MLSRKQFVAHYSNGLKRIMRAVDIYQAQCMARGVARKNNWRVIAVYPRG